MLMQAEPVYLAYESVEKKKRSGISQGLFI